MRGSSAANKNGIDFDDIAYRVSVCQQFIFQRLQVFGNQFVSIGDEGKITIAAMMQTKRDVNIDCPCGCRRLLTHASPLSRMLSGMASRKSVDGL